MEGLNVIKIRNLKTVGTSFEIFVNLAPELAEIGQTSSSHPNNEVSVCDIGPLDLIPWQGHITLGGGIPLCASGALSELVFYIGLPGNIGVINGDVVSVALIMGHTLDIIVVEELISVIEKTLGDKTAWVSRSSRDEQGLIISSMCTTEISIGEDGGA